MGEILGLAGLACGNCKPWGIRSIQSIETKIQYVCVTVLKKVQKCV